MKVLGIPLSVPSSKDMALALALTAAICAFVVTLSWLTGLPSDHVDVIFPGIFAGATTAAFGARVSEHGWRAVVLLTVVGICFAAIFRLVTGLI